jgi:hypothetical protein
VETKQTALAWTVDDLAWTPVRVRVTGGLEVIVAAIERAVVDQVRR